MTGRTSFYSKTYADLDVPDFLFLFYFYIIKFFNHQLITAVVFAVHDFKFISSLCKQM